MSRFTNFESFADYDDQPIRQSGKLLYIDILNYAEFFFPLREPWNVTAAYEYAKKFVVAAKNSGWNIKLFVADNTPSEESAEVWKKRRADEIHKGQKNMPLGSSILIGDMFHAQGIPIIYSDTLSNNDMLAVYAEEDGAAVLSANKVFFAYEGSTFQVYGGYEIKNNTLILKPKSIDDVYKLAESRFLPKKPSTEPRTKTIHCHNGLMKRGTASPLTKYLDVDLQAIITPLRWASFASKGIQGPLTELWPFWDTMNECVAWHQETSVYPTASAEMLALLQQPDRAVEYFFADILKASKPEGVKWHDWVKHLFCVRGLVYELCITDDRSLLDMWLTYERANASRSKPRNNNNNDRRNGADVKRNHSSTFKRPVNTSCYSYDER